MISSSRVIARTPSLIPTLLREQGSKATVSCFFSSSVQRQTHVDLSDNRNQLSHRLHINNRNDSSSSSDLLPFWLIPDANCCNAGRRSCPTPLVKIKLQSPQIIMLRKCSISFASIPSCSCQYLNSHIKNLNLVHFQQS